MSAAFYPFFLNMWVFGRVTETNLTNAVTKGYLTEAEKQQIMATPQTRVGEV